MTFPVLASYQWNEGASGTNHSFVVPAANEGDLLLAMPCAGTTQTFSGWSAGWTTLYDEQVGSLAGNNFLLAKKAGANEPTTLEVTTSGNTKVNCVILRITDWYGDDASDFINSLAWNHTDYAVSTTTPDPPNVAPSWGALDYKWILLLHSQGNNTGTIAYDSNYTEIVNFIDASSAGASVGAMHRDLNASSENPTAFGVTTARDAVVYTIAVRPASGEAGSLLPLKRKAMAGGMESMAGGLY